MKKEFDKIVKFIRNGKLCTNNINDIESLLGLANGVLDKANVHNLFGEVIFEASDGRYYSLNIETTINYVSKDYIQRIIDEQHKPNQQTNEQSTHSST